jgi:acetyl-CoA acyltransferase
MKDMIIPMEVTLADGTRMMADRDQPPRPDHDPGRTGKSQDALQRKWGPCDGGKRFRLNDGACAVLLMNEEKALEMGIEPKMRWVSFAAAAVDPTVMGIAPVPATQKALQKPGLAMDRSGPDRTE